MLAFKYKYEMGGAVFTPKAVREYRRLTAKICITSATGAYRKRYATYRTTDEMSKI